MGSGAGEPPGESGDLPAHHFPRLGVERREVRLLQRVQGRPGVAAERRARAEHFVAVTDRDTQEASFVRGVHGGGDDQGRGPPASPGSLS